jgi:hypothetical protein
MADVIHMTFSFITMVGLILGHLFRCEHALEPLNRRMLHLWATLSIVGLITTPLIKCFYFANIVTIGWFVCEYTIGPVDIRRP